MPQTIPYTVQLEDGSIETFQIDNRVAQEQVPTILEGAVRARQRQKAGLPPVPPVEPPSMFAPTISENIKRAVTGAINIPVQAARDFKSGADYINNNPFDAINLLPELVKAPIRNARAGMKALGNITGQQELVSPGRPPKAGFLDKAKAVANAIPGIGPMADAAGEQAAAGQGPEALGGIAGNVVLADLAMKYDGSMLKRLTKTQPEIAAPKPVAIVAKGSPGITPVEPPTPVTSTPGIIESSTHLPTDIAGAAGGETTAATTNTLTPPLPTGSALPSLKSQFDTSPAIPNTLGSGDITPESIATLRSQLERAPTPTSTSSKPITVRLPLKAGGIPVTFEIGGPRVAAIKALLSTVKGSSLEKLWAQRVISGLSPNRSEDTEGDSWRPILGFQ